VGLTLAGTSAHCALTVGTSGGAFASSWNVRPNAVIGSVNLKGPPDEHGDVEIGWGLHESARGKGYATEAAAAVIQWAFQQPYVCSMRATIADENRGSQLVAQRLGLARSYAIRRDLPLWKIEKIATGD
jgi:[ribosomal protein S5]-alanine N-acetyltransferase